MNQRILSCPTTLFTKGLTLKAGDWRSSEATPETDPNRMRRMSESVTSLSNCWEVTKHNSSSSLRKQFDIQHLSSSSLSSAKRDSSFNFSKNSSMGNASWDDKAVGELGFKQTGSGRLCSSLFDLIQPNIDDPFKHHDHRTKRSSCPTISESAAEETSTLNYRKRSSLSNLISNKKEDEPFKSYAFPGAKNPTQDGNKHDPSQSCTNLKISPSKEDFSEFLVRTSNQKLPKQIDIRGISCSELASLKENDPFMYYSIPAVMSASLNDNAVDLKTIQEAATSLKIPSSYLRKTCISVESWFIPMIDEISCCALPNLSLANNDINMEVDDDHVDLDDDWLYSFYETQTSN